MKSILTMAWTSEDPSAFDLAAKLARSFGARLVGLEPPSYGVMSMAWADAGMLSRVLQSSSVSPSVPSLSSSAS